MGFYSFFMVRANQNSKAAGRQLNDELKDWWRAGTQSDDSSLQVYHYLVFHNYIWCIAISKSRESVCYLTCAVIINHSDRLPLEEVNQVQDGTAEGGEVWIEADVEDVSVVRHLVLPLSLNVWHPQGIANGLDRIGWGTVRGPENGCHPKRKLVTC